MLKLKAIPSFLQRPFSYHSSTPELPLSYLQLSSDKHSTINHHLLDSRCGSYSSVQQGLQFGLAGRLSLGWVVGGEKLGSKLNSAQLGLEALAGLGNIFNLTSK